MKLDKKKLQKGFSLVEMLVVLSVMAVMTSISLYYLYAQQKLYRPDEQASYLIDLLQEARQKALTQKVTMRIEIDITDSVVRLINEEDATTSDDDRIIRSFQLRHEKEVRIDKRPSNITVNPVEPTPVNPIAYINESIYPLSLGHKVATIRFKKDGTITDAGTTATGTNSIVAGTTIFIWQPSKTDLDNSEITRAVTIIGGSGALRLWNYYPGLPTAKRWQDSRRFQ
jgi:prepilin-type N-terminal cleavage/methylation domain-containing protein